MSKTSKALTLGTLILGSTFASPYAMAACDGLDLTGSMAITSEYHFRGVDTSNGAAVQGSLDTMHCPTGLYIGGWGSNAFGDAGATEVDAYGGWRYQVGDFGLDLGAIGYFFPENRENGIPSTDYVEGYIGGSWKWLSFTVYYADDYFNTEEEAWYFAGGFSWPFKPDLSLNIHAGYSTGDGVDRFFGNTQNYFDYEVMLVKNVADIFDVGIGVVGTDLDDKDVLGDIDPDEAEGSGAGSFIFAGGHDDSPKFLVRVSKDFDI